MSTVLVTHLMQLLSSPSELTRAAAASRSSGMEQRLKAWLG